MHPKGARKNKLAQAIFSNEGPNLKSPEVTKRPKVIPNRYSDNSKNKSGIPRLKTDTPKKGIAKIAPKIPNRSQVSKFTLSQSRWS